MEFKYTDSFGDTLKLKNLATRGTVAIQIMAQEDINTVVLPYDEVRGLAEALMEVSGEGSYIIPKTGSEVAKTAGVGWISCGEDKTLVSALPNSNPRVLLARAANLVTIAQAIQAQTDLAAVEQAKADRRDKVTRELSGNPTGRYEYATDLAKAAIDLIIELQDEKEEKKND